MSSGWIKLHRVIRSKFWYKKSDVVHLFTHILLTASHKEERIYFNGSFIEISPGQLVTGRKKLSEETGIKESRITRILDLLEADEIISSEGTNRYRVLTVLNWSKYQQKEDEKSEQQTNSKRTAERTTNEQQKNGRDPSIINVSGQIPNSNEQQKRTTKKTETEQKANTIQEEKKNKKKEEQEEGGEGSALAYLDSAKKLLLFLKENPGAAEALRNAARFDGTPEDMEEEVLSFFAYYSDNSYFVKDSGRFPYKYIGKLQKWLQNSKNFKPKQKNKDGKNRITADFKGKLRDALDDW